MKKLFNKRVTISYYAPGARNDLGEPTRVLTERNSKVPCRLELKSKSLAYEFPQRVLRQTKQGFVDITTHILSVSAGQTIEVRDIVTYNSDNYLVALVNTLGNHHTEALMSRVTGI